MGSKTYVTVIGGGLAGSEAAYQIAEAGIPVHLYEMRPSVSTGAHVSDKLGELVCSNSLGSNLIDRAAGLLKQELRILGSLLINIADQTSVPAGSALAVDREEFANQITQILSNHPLIEIYRKEVTEIPSTITVVASGPLTSAKLTSAISEFTGEEQLYFFDAISPIVSLDSVDFGVAFRGSRYGRGIQADGDYINCPMDESQYLLFVNALKNSARIELQSFELEVEKGVRAGYHQYFESCLPVEIIAERGEKALAFGPLRPVGISDPRTNRRPYAVVQLRQDNLAGTLYNLVGFQTNLKFSEQKRVFRMIPGLEQADFVRYGQMHRNTFVHSPKVLNQHLQSINLDSLFFAGQITGAEGYAGNIATGLIAGLNVIRRFRGGQLLEFPPATMVGALITYITQASPQDFQPMKANFGIVPPLTDGKKRNKRERAAAYSERALNALRRFLQIHGVAHP